jgi:hypothetical protein
MHRGEKSEDIGQCLSLNRFFHSPMMNLWLVGSAVCCVSSESWLFGCNGRVSIAVVTVKEMVHAMLRGGHVGWVEIQK